MSKNDAIRAFVPTPGEELPSRAGLYPTEQADPSGATLVRADVTYLTQDFSVMQKVANPGAWPSYQRFDYLVRVRPLSFIERIVLERPQDENRARAPSAHKEAILHALRSLTGRDAGNSAAAWQELLRTMRSER